MRWAESTKPEAIGLRPWAQDGL